jgi:hypothetical protein
MKPKGSCGYEVEPEAALNFGTVPDVVSASNTSAASGGDCPQGLPSRRKTQLS